MRKQLLLVLSAMTVISCFGCSKPARAPAMKRLVSSVHYNQQFLQDKALPRIPDAAVRLALRDCCQKLAAQIVEVHAFMQLVETGEIDVYENFKGGLWQSSLDKGGFRIWALYNGRTAPLNEFRIGMRCLSNTPLVWDHTFYPNGSLKCVTSVDWMLQFDETGKLKVFTYTTPEGKPVLEVAQDGSSKLGLQVGATRKVFK